MIIGLLFFFLIIAGTTLTAWGWQTEVKGITTAPLALGENHIFAATDNGYVYSVNIADGTVSWQKKISNSRSGLKFDNKTLYVITSGSILSLDENSGNEEWSYDVASSAPSIDFYYFPSIDISNGHIYFSIPNGMIYSLDKDVGELEWAYNTNQPKPSVVASSGSLLYGGSNDGMFFSLSSGEKVWEYTTGGTNFTNPVFSKNNVLVGSDQGYIYSFNKESGKLNWSYPKFSKPPLENPPLFLAISGNNLVAILLNGNVIVLKDNGKLKWKYESPAGFLSQPNVTDMGFYAGSNDSKIRVFSFEGSNIIDQIYTLKGNYVSTPVFNDDEIFYADVDSEKGTSKITSSPKEEILIEGGNNGYATSIIPFLSVINSSIEQTKDISSYESEYIQPVKLFAAPLGSFIKSLKWQITRGPNFNFLFTLAIIGFMAAIVCGPFGIVIFFITMFMYIPGKWFLSGFYIASATDTKPSGIKDLFYETYSLYKSKIALSRLYFVSLMCLLILISVFSYLTSTFFTGVLIIVLVVLLIGFGSLLKTLTLNYYSSDTLKEALTDSFSEDWRSILFYYAFFFFVFSILAAIVIAVRTSFIGLVFSLSALFAFIYFFSTAESSVIAKEAWFVGRIKRNMALVQEKPEQLAFTYFISAFFLAILSFTGLILFKNWVGVAIESYLLSKAFSFTNCMVWTLERENIDKLEPTVAEPNVIVDIKDSTETESSNSIKHQPKHLSKKPKATNNAKESKKQKKEKPEKAKKDNKSQKTAKSVKITKTNKSTKTQKQTKTKSVKAVWANEKSSSNTKGKKGKKS